jgi:hypothetical protein
LSLAAEAFGSHLFGPHGYAIGHAVQPLGDGLSLADRRSAARQDKESSLKRVLGVVLAGQDVPANGPNQPAVAAHQRVFCFSHWRLRMIYGYSISEVNEYGLLEMREVTFMASPAVLRKIAGFLSSMAIEMEQGSFEKCSHMHIGAFHHEWNKQHPDKDIIVMPPAGERKEEPPSVLDE